jgi:radical SAM protein (TIGR01212 family)
MYTYSQYLKNRFGEPVLKIPLNGGFSCPNRDGSKGRGGCLFCENRAFSPVTDSSETILKQLEKGISRAPERFRKFIAYFQPYSNTYGTVKKLRSVFEPVLEVPEIVGIAAGTRPDCFSSDVYDYLRDLSHRTYMSIELGLQTVHDSTLQAINRHQTHAEGIAAITELNKRGIEIVVHVILGLPGETRSMMLQTAESLAGLPVQGVKLHQLMIIRGTEMEKKFRAGEVAVLSLEEYADLAASFIRLLGADKCIHRLVADCLPEAGLIAPLWSNRKAKVIESVKRILKN